MSTLGQIGQMARRSILQTLRQPAMVIPPVLFPLILMGINVSGLDAATKIPDRPPIVNTTMKPSANSIAVV